jgi:predicted metal-dependent phosphoesterase TrpH
MLRADFHCHTRYSHDCFASVREVLATAARRELTHLAITDHDTLEGTLRARDQSRQVQVIVGCEITLTGGKHVIGLFLEKPVKAREFPEAVAEIHAQGGFVLVPHPLHPKSGLFGGPRFAVAADATERVPPGIDAIEVCSGYEPAAHNLTAAAWSREHRVPMLAGSDAHYGVDVGRCCVEFDALELTPEVLRSAPRRLWQPAQDLSAIHAGDAAFRAETAPAIRRVTPKPLRNLAKRANWLRFRRLVRARLADPVRTEFQP